MISFKFSRKANGVPVLSKSNIEDIAKVILNDYNPNLLEEPTALDVEHLLECYAGLEVDYKNLTHNRSILGMIVFNDGYVPVYDEENNKAKILPVEEGTILIDNSLLEEDQIRRGRFTVCHEVAHWFLHRDQYMVDKNQLNLFDSIPGEAKTAIKCRSTDIESNYRKELVTDDDWMEWQADYLASALLMPEEQFIKVYQNYVELLGLEDQYEEMIILADTNIYVDGVMKYVAEIFDVSLASARIRLKNLGLIKDNRQESII